MTAGCPPAHRGTRKPTRPADSVRIAAPGPRCGLRRQCHGHGHGGRRVCGACLGNGPISSFTRESFAAATEPEVPNGGRLGMLRLVAV